MHILIAGDHGSHDLKPALVKELEKTGAAVKDLGLFSPDRGDYPQIVQKACQEFLLGSYDFGILICGTGIGVSIAANKIKGIRCALVYDLYTAQMAKKHNNANFLAMGGRTTYSTPPIDIVKQFMTSSFEGQRHQRRLSQISDMEE